MYFLLAGTNKQKAKQKVTIEMEKCRFVSINLFKQFLPDYLLDANRQTNRQKERETLNYQ